VNLHTDAVTAGGALPGRPAHPEGLSAPQAAAMAMEPMTDAECAEVGRILARIERRRTEAGQHGEAA
jgi:hypothetical protein